MDASAYFGDLDHWIQDAMIYFVSFRLALWLNPNRKKLQK